MNIRRILLLVPPVTRPADYGADKMRVSPFFPLGLAYLAAVLRDRYEVKVLDCLLEGYERGGQLVVPFQVPELALAAGMDRGPLLFGGPNVLRYGLMDYQITKAIMDFNPDVVGVSCLFSAQEWDARNLCRLAKSVDPRIVTVLGGPHAGANAREIMEAESAVDYVVIGEGEESFPDLLEELRGDYLIPATDGTAFRSVVGTVCQQSKRFYISNLSTLPFPAWDMVNMDGYLRLMQPHDRCKQRPFMPVSTSRGCPFRCGFCAIRGHWGDRPRFRSADNVLWEIASLQDCYGVREIHFEDDNLTADRERALAIFRGLQDYRFQSGPVGPLVWAAPSGLAMAKLDGELLDAMAKSGCYSVSLAIESGNQDILRLMHKPVDLRRVPSLVKEIQARGMLCKGFFILGYPGETKETIRQTVEFAKSLELDWAFFFIASPLPHTEMWAQALEAGMIAQGERNPLTSMHEPILKLPGVEHEWLKEITEQAKRDICFTNNPNISRNPLQAVADFEHVLGLYPQFEFAREALERARANL